MSKLDEFMDRLEDGPGAFSDGMNEVQDAIDGPTLRHEDAPERWEYEDDDAGYYAECIEVARDHLQDATSELVNATTQLEVAVYDFPEEWDVRSEPRDEFDEDLAAVFEAVEEVARWRDELERFETAYRDEN